MMKLGDICSFQSGGTPSRSNSKYFNGTIPWITTVALTGGVIDENSAVEFISDDAIRQSAAKIVKPYSIMVGTRVGVGKVAINSVAMSTSQDVVSLIDIDETKWNKMFLVKLIQAKNNFLNSQARGATIKGIKIEVLAELELPDIDLPTQRWIADTLDKVSEGIEVCRKMLGELDLMVKAKFVEMFGDPVSNEREWNVETLNDVCTEIGDGLHGTPEYDDNGEYPFINGNNLINGAIEITPATKKVNAEIYKKHYIDISANALLLSINGTLGKLAFYNGEKVMLGKSACYCNFKPEINRAFVYGVMKTEAFAGFLEKSATASTIKNVGLKAIRGYKLIMPPQALQMQFIEFSNQVDKSKLAVKQSLEKLETLKKSLMQEYLG